jgi:hypothetical protein
LIHNRHKKAFYRKSTKGHSRTQKSEGKPY